MPRMTHWSHPEPIDVPGKKAAVYAAQGWVTVGGKTPKVQPAIIRESTEGVVEQPPAKPTKRTPAKKAAKKAGK